MSHRMMDADERQLGTSGTVNNEELVRLHEFFSTKNGNPQGESATEFKLASEGELNRFHHADLDATKNAEVTGEEIRV